ncbi:MAG TPA: hypothetical protein VMF89_32200 [Polyangiales bacterium]|nr:hypothetical protein [Polyangiales bacterium]
MLAFFRQLRTELGFYIGALNLKSALESLGQPTCMPEPCEPRAHVRFATALYDPCLALSTSSSVVANDLEANDALLVLITGANRGGKSTFLRSIGVAQLMMQCGMFVAAARYRSSIAQRILTHYGREEDCTMTSGRLDEELGRMSSLVDELVPDSMVLLNESFASTNEREGSEIADQVVRALVERRITVYFVTHLYQFAQTVRARGSPSALFLVANRECDGVRTFKLSKGLPATTSYARDLYNRIIDANP